MNDDDRDLGERLQESEEMFRQLTEVNDQVFYLASVDFKVMHYVSASYEKVWDRTCASLYANPLSWVDAVHPQDREQVRADLGTHKGGRFELQYRIVRKDGSVRWILARHGDIKDTSGTVQRLCGVALDITDLKEAQRDVVKSEMKYRRLFEAAKDGILILDADTGAIVEINPFVLQLLGYTAEECYGKKLWEIGFFSDASLSKSLFKELQATGYVRYEDVPLRTKAGQAVAVEFVSNVYSVGGVAVVQCNIRDNTARKRAEETLRQSQKMEGIGRLAGGVAHDFNNLLTGIMGYSGFLLENLPEGDPNRADVTEILRASERAASLTRQLLAFSRQQVLTVKVLDLNAVIGDLEKMLRRLIRESITFTFKPGAALGHVKAAQGQVDQILMNLCLNAKDAMKDGGELLIATSNVSPTEADPRPHPGGRDGPSVLLAVSDTGHGMSADVLSHVFEPFFTTKDQGLGTGLGLSTVYGIVQQNGGSIEVDSAVGRGTTVNIYLPRCDAPLEAPHERVNGGSPTRGKEVVLVVEDDASVGRYIGRALTEQGYTVLSAASPSEALRLCADHAAPIGLLLTDIVMPEMLGYELCRRVSALRPGIRTVFMSGYSETALIERATEHGATFLQKPMAAGEIAAAVRAALDASPPGAAP